MRPQGAQDLRRRHDTVNSFDNSIESRDDTSDSVGFTASEEDLRRQRAILELTRPVPPRDRVRSDDSTVREVAHVFAMQRGHQAEPSVVDPLRGLGFQNQEAAGPSSSAEPSRHHQRLDRAITGPMNGSGHLDFGPVVGPNWVHRDQPSPASLILQLRQTAYCRTSDRRPSRSIVWPVQSCGGREAHGTFVFSVIGMFRRRNLASSRREHPWTVGLGFIAVSLRERAVGSR